MMKTTKLTAKTLTEARGKIADLYAKDFNDGDKAEVTFPDGDKHIYIFKDT